MKQFLFPIILTTTIISGCATGPLPQNAVEYRQLFSKGAWVLKLEVYEIDRPYSKVSETLRKNGDNCFNTSFWKRKCFNNICNDYEVTFTPTIISNKQKTELHIQWRRTPWDGNIDDSQISVDGIYITIADAEPIGNSKTKMTIYGPSLAHLQTIPDAIKHWAAGTNLGCPDLSKPYYY